MLEPIPSIQAVADLGAGVASRGFAFAVELLASVGLGEAQEAVAAGTVGVELSDERCRVFALRPVIN